MGCVLYLAHTADGNLLRPALEGLTAAREIAGLTGLPLATGLVGTGVEAAAASLAGIGVSSFLAVEGEPYANGRYHVIPTCHRLTFPPFSSGPGRNHSCCACSLVACC